jgi:hypothetical protein
MNDLSEDDVLKIWGPYVNYDDVARLQYGRRFWCDPVMKQRLLTHWLDERHPYRERFMENRPLIEEALTTTIPDGQFDADLRMRGSSLRCVAREIPPVFGSFF